MKKLKTLFLSSILILTVGIAPFAYGLSQANSSLGLLSNLSGVCPKPLNCSYGTNFLSLSDAELCGCCSCHGGANGCTGGAKGRIMCMDGTVADGCACQYTVEK